MQSTCLPKVKQQHPLLEAHIALAWIRTVEQSMLDAAASMIMLYIASICLLCLLAVHLWMPIQAQCTILLVSLLMLSGPNASQHGCLQALFIIAAGTADNHADRVSRFLPFSDGK